MNTNRNHDMHPHGMLITILAALCMCIPGQGAIQQDSLRAGGDSTAAKRGARAPRSIRAPRPPAPGVFTSLDSALRMPDSVRVLNLRGQSVSKLPPGVAKFKNLVAVDLSSCGLTAFPKELLSCIQITSINLSDNAIGSVPPEIDALQSLTRLSLRNTALTTLPQSIGKCQQLSQLELQGNPLKTLPIAEINRLPRLRSLVIGGWKDAEPQAPSKPEPAPKPKK